MVMIMVIDLSRGRDADGTNVSDSTRQKNELDPSADILSGARTAADVPPSDELNRIVLKRVYPRAESAALGHGGEDKPHRWVSDSVGHDVQNMQTVVVIERKQWSSDAMSRSTPGLWRAAKGATKFVVRTWRHSLTMRSRLALACRSS